MACRAFVTGDQENGHVGNVEQERSEVQPAPLRNDDLERVAPQTGATHVRRRAPDARRKKTHPRERCQPLQEQHRPLRVKAPHRSGACPCPTSEGARIGGSGVAIFRLDEHQRQGGPSVWNGQTEFAAIVRLAPRIYRCLCVRARPIADVRKTVDSGCANAERSAASRAFTLSEVLECSLVSRQGAASQSGLAPH